MARVFSILFLLLAYAAGTSHCAFAAMLCASAHAQEAAAAGGSVAVLAAAASEDGGEHTGSPVRAAFGSHSSGQHSGHLPHEEDCVLDKGLGSAAMPTPFNAPRGADLSVGGCDCFAAVFAVCHACFHCQRTLLGAQAVFPERASGWLRDRVLVIAHGWQFLCRAAGLVRAPSAGVA